MSERKPRRRRDPVHNRPSNTWTPRVDVQRPNPETGETEWAVVQLHPPMKRKGEARAMMDAYYAELDAAGARPGPDTATMRTFLPIWRESFKRGARSTNRTNAYRITDVLDMAVDGAAVGDMPLSLVDSRVVSELRAAMIAAPKEGTSNKGWSIATARNHLNTLSAFFGDAVEHYAGGTNPFWRAAKRLPAQPATPRDQRWKPWTLVQMRNICAAAEARYRPMMFTLATGGFRRGELLALKRVNVDWGRCMVYVDGTEHEGQWSPTNRNKNHDRWVPLPDDVMQMLADHPPYAGCEWLFYTPGQVRQARVQWPGWAELDAEVKATSYKAVSRRLGVSDNAVRNRLRNHVPGHEPGAVGGGKMWWGDNFVDDVFAPTCARAGVTASPKQFRASLNQHMKREGVSAEDRKAFFGHSVKVNEQHYLEVEIDDLASVRRALG